MDRTNARKVHPSGRSIVVSLPRDLRETVGVETGDDVVFDYDGEKAVMRKAEVSITTADGEDA